MNQSTESNPKGEKVFGKDSIGYRVTNSLAVASPLTGGTWMANTQVTTGVSLMDKTVSVA